MRLKRHSGRAFSANPSLTPGKDHLRWLSGYLSSTSHVAKRKSRHWQNVFMKQSRPKNFTSNPYYTKEKVESLISTQGTELCSVS